MATPLVEQGTVVLGYNGVSDSNTNSMLRSRLSPDIHKPRPKETGAKRCALPDTKIGVNLTEGGFA
jgi:hypothetical protein